MKKDIRFFLWLSLVAALLVCGCATHQPTTIRSVPFPSVGALDDNAVCVSAAMYYLGKLDSLEGSKKSRYGYDQKLINNALGEALAKVPSRGIRIIGQDERPTGRFHCEIKAYEFVNWMEVLYTILPIPRTTNKSICIAAALTDKKSNKTIKQYEEWGFSKRGGFFIFEGAYRPPSGQLRDFLLRKVMKQVMEDVNNAVASPSTSSQSRKPNNQKGGNE